jgi:hypothetical protein
MDRCRTELPPLRLLARPGTVGSRVAACWLQDGPVPPPAELARPEPAPGPRPGPDPGPDPGPAPDTNSPTTGMGDTMAGVGAGANTTGGTA